MAEQLVLVPDLGGTDSVEVIELAVAAGEQVEEGQTLLVVESDKASMDIPAPFSGSIIEVLVSEGSEVAEGDPLVKMQLDAAAEPDKDAGSAEPVPASESEPTNESESVAATQTVTAAAATATASTSEEVTVPDLGGADSVEVIEISVAVGDTVAEGDALLVLESDKASMDLPAPVAGTVTAILTSVGDAVSEGVRVLTLEVAGNAAAVEGAAADSPAPAAEPAPQAATPDTAQAAAPSATQRTIQSTMPSAAKPTTETSAPRAANGAGPVYAGPAVRKLARELGVELSRVTGTGPKGRIAKEDLHNFVKQAVKAGPAGTALAGNIAPLPDIDFSQFGAVDTQPMSKLQKLTAANMQRAWLTVPHVTQFDDADITELEAFRQSLKKEMEQRGVKVSPVAFIMRAVAATLRAVPSFNVSITADGESLVHKDYVHIGMAVDTPQGLLVPVIRDVDKKGLWEIAAEISDLAVRARERKLKPADMQGACFTISSLGAIGGRGFTPIVNTPEVGILGVSNSSVQPVYRDGEFQPRTMLPLSLSYDHRAVNGGDAGRFLTQLVASLEDLRRLLL